MTRALISLVYREHLLGWQDICYTHLFAFCTVNMMSFQRQSEVKVVGYQLALLTQRSLATTKQQQQLGFVLATFELVSALDLQDTVSRPQVRILILGDFSSCNDQRGARARAQ